MPVTLSSDFTFSIPTLIRGMTDSTPAYIKRISADGVTPVVLEASQGILPSCIKPGHYLGYQTDPALKNTLVLRRIAEVGNQLKPGTGVIKHDPDSIYKVIGIGTDFSELVIYGKVVIQGEILQIIDIDLVNQVLTFNQKVPEFQHKSIFFYETYIIILQNPRGEHWNDFPTIYSALVYYSKDNNVRYRTNDVVELYHRIQSVRTQSLVYDFDFTPGDAVDLKMERASYRRGVVVEDVRNETIWDRASFINEAKDIGGELSQNIYTIKNNGALNAVSLRHELNMTLADEIIRITVYIADIDGDGNSTTDWELKIDVREDSLGHRYNTNFVNVS